MNRRTVLRATGAAIATGVGASAAAGAADADDERDATGVYPFDRSGDGFEFERVYDVVEDLGADPTGEERIDDILADHVQNDTKFVFPEGTYKLGQFRNNEGPLNCFCSDQYYPLENVWFEGRGSDRTVLKPPNGWGRPDEDHEQPWGTLFWEIRYGENVRFEGFGIDYTHEATGSRFQIYPSDGLYVRDVHQMGTNTNNETSFAFQLYDSDGYGLVQDLRAPDGSVNVDENESGGSGMYVPESHSGTLELRDCHLEGFQDNGLYASSPGPESQVVVNGGYYANSNISNVRVGWNGVVKNATIVVDEEIDTDYTVNMRGIRQQDGAGTVVKNCDVVYTADAASSGAIVNASRGGEMTVKNTRIHVGDGGTTHAINAKSPAGVDHDGNVIESESVAIENVSITGDAADGSSIRIDYRNGNVLRNVCIEEDGSDRDGVVFVGSTGTIRNARIDVGGEPVSDDGGVETHNVRDRANCTEPRER